MIFLSKKSASSKHRFAAGALLALCAALPLSAQAQQTTQVSLRQGVNSYTGVSDTLISAHAPNANFGAYNRLVIGVPGAGGERRSLLRFDLSAYAGQTVSGDATLTLRQDASATIYEDFTILVYQISAANANWTQGNGSGGAASAGEPAWNFKAEGGASADDTAWAGSAGLSTQGLDYVATPVATFSALITNSNKDISIVIPEAVIQNWIDNPSANGGFLFMRGPGSQAANMAGFYSSDFGGEAARPQLEFTLVNVPEASTYPLIAGSIAIVSVWAIRRRRAAPRRA